MSKEIGAVHCSAEDEDTKLLINVNVLRVKISKYIFLHYHSPYENAIMQKFCQTEHQSYCYCIEFH